MKKTYLYMVAAALIALGTSCSEDNIQGAGEGSLKLKTAINADVKIESRATIDELAEKGMVWISNEKGLVRRYDDLNTIPSDISLLSGHYVAEAWAGDSVSASFSDRFFYGREEFDIAAGTTAAVNLTAKIANVVASVKYQDGLEDVLTDFTMTIGHSRGSLIFEGRDEHKGYFMMPSTDTDLTYTLRGKQMNGQEFVLDGTIAGAQKATEYILNVTFAKKPSEIGGTVLTIRVDKTEISKEESVEIIAAPKFEGYDFNINEPILCEKGNVGRRTIYISTASKLKSVILTSDYFKSLAAFGGDNDVDLLAASASFTDQLDAIGINFKSTEFNTEDGAKTNGMLFQLNFEEEFTNTLDNGDYEFNIAATDATEKKSTATMTINISDNPVQTIAVEDDDVDYFSATLTGVVSKEDAENIGFNYRAAGETEWQFIAGEVSSRSYTVGTIFTAKLSNLQSGTTYQYTAVSADFEGGKILSFTTRTEYQLENASFEDWMTCVENGKNVVIPGTSYPGSFWDSGNHGSATMDVTLTQASQEKVHSGKYSAKLRSQFVGLGGALGKFAAGNIFIGKYLATEGTDGVIGFGKEFKGSPKSVSFWMHYTPGIVEKTSTTTADILPKGSLDQGMIYVVLLDDKKIEENKYDGIYYPCLVKTKKAAKLFDPAAANIIAYGELPLTQATQGDNLVETRIEFNYLRPEDKNKVSNIMFVATASRYGDYFTGGEGSTLYLDDIHLEY